MFYVSCVSKWTDKTMSPQSPDGTKLPTTKYARTKGRNSYGKISPINKKNMQGSLFSAGLFFLIYIFIII